MSKEDVHSRLAEHLRHVGLPIPFSEEFLEILRETLTPLEAEVALTLPSNVGPLEFRAIDEIRPVPGLEPEDMVRVLEGLCDRGVIFSGKTKTGQTGYALWQRGFGFPQSFHWKGEDTPHARKMAQIIDKYNKNPKVLQQSRVDFQEMQTKPYRYVPVGRSIPTEKQAVYSLHMMEDVIQKAEAFGLCHCPCRIKYNMADEGCEHPTDVCMKFDDAARFLIERGFARELTRDEALEVVRRSEEAGLVHFVDNAAGQVQHNCNCCGCACWNVGPIRRRAVPRDVIMATYFLRETDEDACIGCGACAEICPVKAVRMEEDRPVVDLDWCIGCGVCATRCPADAITTELRPDRSADLPATFRTLHQRILEGRR